MSSPPTKKRRITIGQDFLTTLPQDCIFDIFQYFNHHNLDTIALVNQKSFSLSEMYRRKVKKEEAYTLTLRKRTNGDVLLIAHLKNRSFLICNYSTDGNLSERKITTEYGVLPHQYSSDVSYGCDLKHAVLSCGLFNRMKYLLERYEYESIRINSIYIDKRFMEHLSKNFAENNHHTLVLRNVNFGKDFFDRNMQSFASHLLSMRPTNLYLHDNKYFFKAISHDFLRRFAKNIQNPSLGIYACNTMKICFLRALTDKNFLKDQPVHISEDMFGSLVNYKYLDLANIVVEAESLMELIKRGIQQGSLIRWTISTTRKLEKDGIIASLTVDMEYESNLQIVGSHLIRYARDNEVFKFNIHMEKGKNDNFTSVSIDKCLPVQIIRRV